MDWKRFISALVDAACVTGVIALLFALIIYLPEFTLTAFLILIFLIITFLAY